MATIGADSTGRPTTSTPTASPAAIAEALGAAKLVYLTDIEGLRRDVADAASLIRQTTADELDELIADGTIAGGMIPKVEACTHAVRNGVGRAHILDGRIAHVLLLEIFTDEGIGTMITNPTTEGGSRMNVFESVGLHESPFMPVFAPPSRDVRSRQGHRAVRHRGASLPRLPVGHRRHVARPRPPGGRRGDRHPGPRTAPREQLLRQPNLDRGGGGDQPAPRRGHRRVGQDVLHQLGAESIECALKLGRKFGGRGRHVGRQRLRELPRPHPRRARRHRPAGQARAVLADARGLQARRVGRRRRARGRGRRNGRRRADRADPGRGRGQPGAARIPGGDPRRCATAPGR